MGTFITERHKMARLILDISFSQNCTACQLDLVNSLAGTKLGKDFFCLMPL